LCHVTIRIRSIRQASRRALSPFDPAKLTFGFGILFLASLGTALLIALDAARDNTFELQRTLSEITFAYTDYQVLGVGRRDGGIVTLTDDWSDHPGIRESMDRVGILERPTWCEILRVGDFQAPHINVAEPVHQDGAFLGYVFAFVSISELSRFLERFDRQNATHSFILYGRDRVLAHRSLVEGFAAMSEKRALPDPEDIEDDAVAAIWGEVIDEKPDVLGDSGLEGHVVRGPDDDYICFYRVPLPVSESRRINQPWPPVSSVSCMRRFLRTRP